MGGCSLLVQTLQEAASIVLHMSLWETLGTVLPSMLDLALGHQGMNTRSRRRGRRPNVSHALLLGRFVCKASSFVIFDRFPV